MLSRYGDSPMPSDEDYKNKIIHARLKFDDNVIMISDAFKGNKASTHENIQLSVEAENENKWKKRWLINLVLRGCLIMKRKNNFKWA